MAGLTIRPSVPEDAQAVELLRLAGWQTAYRGIIPDDYLDSLAADVARRRHRIEELPEGYTDLVATADGAVVGWIAGGPSSDPDLSGARHGEIFACYVHPDWWRKGVGRLLMGRAIEVLTDAGRDDITLWVLEANDRARQFYAEFGFAPDGARKLWDRGGTAPEVRYRRRAGAGHAPQPGSGRGK